MIHSEDVEQKAVDLFVLRASIDQVDRTTTSQGSWSEMYTLNGIVRGTDVNQRIGRKVRMTKLELRGSWSTHLLGLYGGYLRMVILYDKQANGTEIGINDAFSVDACFSPFNINAQNRIEIVYDDYVKPICPIVSSSGDPGIGGPTIQPFDICIDLNHEVTFNAFNNGTYTDIETGTLLLTMAQAGFSTEDDPEVDFYARVWYVDM